MTYNIGDKVKLRQGMIAYEMYGKIIYLDDMEEVNEVNKYYTISKCDNDRTVKLAEDPNEYWWAYDMIECKAPQTNLFKIQAMTAEEIGTFILNGNACDRCVYNNNGDKYLNDCLDNKDMGCADGVMKWLMQEAKDTTNNRGDNK